MLRRRGDAHHPRRLLEDGKKPFVFSCKLSPLLTRSSPFHSAPHPHAPLATRPQTRPPCPHKRPLSEAIRNYYNGDVPTSSVKSHDKKAIFDKFFEDHSDKPDLQAKTDRQRKSLWTNAMALLREGQKIDGSGISTKYTKSNQCRHHANQNAERGKGFAAIFNNGTVGALDFIAGCNGVTEVADLYLSMLTDEAMKGLGVNARQFDQLSEKERAKAIGDVDKIKTMLKLKPVMSYDDAHEQVIRAADSRGGNHALLANAPVKSILRGFRDWASDTSNLRGASDRVR